jgi:type III secretion system low calcium response chaperone LcrH/SycD
MIEKTCAKYWEFLINNFMNELIKLSESDYLSDEEMETLYSLGYYLFCCGKYDEAKDVFYRLTAYSPYTAHYWRALGAVNQQKKDYAAALAAYDMAIANDEKDIISRVYRAESEILSGFAEAGLKDLEEAAKIGSEDPDSAAWVNRAKLIIRLHKQP